MGVMENALYNFLTLRGKIKDGIISFYIESLYANVPLEEPWQIKLWWTEHLFFQEITNGLSFIANKS